MSPYEYEVMFGTKHVPHYYMKIVEKPMTIGEIFRYKIWEPLKEIFWICFGMFGISLMLFSYFKFFSIFIK
jgi:hypothetical protein